MTLMVNLLDTRWVAAVYSAAQFSLTHRRTAVTASSIPLNSRQRFALRTIIQLLGSAYKAAEEERGSYHHPQYRGIAIWNAWCESIKAWAEATDEVSAPEKAPTLIVVLDDVGFVPRKAGLSELGQLASARIVHNAIERRRIRHTLARQQRTLFPDPEAEWEAAELGVSRYIHVVHVGSKQLVELWLGERIGRNEWVNDVQVPLLSEEYTESEPMLLAFNRGDIPPLPGLQPVGKDALDQPTTGRFQDETAELDLGVTGRPAVEDDQQGTDEGA